uniref:ARAD1D10450p n=1 Tax=Blastobotrys adeninivorans TaxID=409370 RepID=A0A060TET2_BLAAD
MDYNKFEQYPFEDDDEFKAGLEQILSNPGVDKTDVELKAKAFFFQKRTGEVIDLDNYLKWKQEQEGQEGTQASGTTDTSTEEPVRLSYAEVIELITSGKPVPGIRDIPSVVLGTEASSEPKAQQRKKPWEQ